MQTKRRRASLTIASGQTVSEAIECTNFVEGGQTIDNNVFTPKGIIFPITTGDSFSFEVSEDGQTYVQLRDAENTAIAITKTAGAASAHPLSAQDFAGWAFVRVVSDAAEGADRILILTGYTV